MRRNLQLNLYNTLSRKKENFKPIKDKQVGLYTCGPTVYDYAHLGNLRTYIFEDLLKRTLIHNGYRVEHIMNITDVDDKTIKRAQQEKIPLKKLTNKYTKIFFEDSKKLNIQPADKYPKASEHIDGMVRLIKILLKKGIAYESKGDGIYFNISRFKNYGKLAHLSQGDFYLQRIGRSRHVRMDEYDRKLINDFALWKFWDKDRDGDNHWEKRGLGRGRPGWHIECSVMSKTYLGQPFDIHTGGIDLVFPHHENEIAQSEAAYNTKMVNFWLHGEHLLVDSQKMAKSRGNFITLRTLEQKGFNPLAFRYLILGTHFRQKINFTWDSLEAAQRGLAQVYGFLYNIFLENREFSKNSNKTFIKRLQAERKKFEQAVNNDLNSPKALAVMFNSINEIWADLNSTIKISKSDLAEVEKLFLDFDKIFGLGFKKYLDRGKKEELPKKVKEMITKREALRRSKKFSDADEIRKEIEKKGYEVEDTKHGPRIKRKEI